MSVTEGNKLKTEPGTIPSRFWPPPLLVPTRHLCHALPNTDTRRKAIPKTPSLQPLRRCQSISRSSTTCTIPDPVDTLLLHRPLALSAIPTRPAMLEDVTLPHIIRSNPAGFGGLRRTPMDSSSNFLAEWLTETFIPGNANSGLNVTGSPVSDRTEFRRNHLKTGGSSRSFLKLT